MRLSFAREHISCFGTRPAIRMPRGVGCRLPRDVVAEPVEAGLAVRLALPFVDVLIANEPELLLAAGCSGMETAVEALRRRGIPTLVSKLGERGTRIYRGDESVFLPPYSVEVCTTIGAGDGFAAGFLYALLNEFSLEECLHYGNAAAAVVVSRLSCSEAMPTLDEVRAMIRDQRNTVEKSSTSQVWR